MFPWIQHSMWTNSRWMPVFIHPALGWKMHDRWTTVGAFSPARCWAAMISQWTEERTDCSINRTNRTTASQWGICSFWGCISCLRIMTTHDVVGRNHLGLLACGKWCDLNCQVEKHWQDVLKTAVNHLRLLDMILVFFNFTLLAPHKPTHLNNLTYDGWWLFFDIYISISF